MADEWTGQDIDSRYVVEGVLGRGGMGIVLRARHRFTGAEVALKLLHAELSCDARMQERFLTECRASAAIGHPAIVQVLDAGKTAEGELYLAMELLEGRSLRAAMSPPAGATGEAARRAPRVPPEAARRIALALLDALGAAHARGFVHRDLKPENVFLAGPAGAVKLLDFGVAKSLTGASAASTAAGIVLGTVSYMAPEQLADARTVDGRADLWAVGVMLYELLAGALPYRASNLGELMSALALSEPVPIQVHLPSVDASVRAFFARALARDRSQRFASAHDMARALAAVAIETAVPPPQTMGGLPTIASGETDPQRARLAAPALAPVVRPPAAAPREADAPWSQLPRLAAACAPRPQVPRLAAAAEQRWLAVAIAAVAVVAIVAGVIAIATSGSGRAAAVAAAAASVAPDRISAATELAAAPEAPRAEAARPPEALCEAACRSGCGLEGSDCARLCAADPRAVRCLETVGTSDCQAWSRCVLGASCSGEPPRGEVSCGDTLACERSCRDNISCSCSCLGRMSPSHALAMTRLSICALFMCAGDAGCMQSRCKEPLEACEPVRSRSSRQSKGANPIRTR
jgi:serine/threonine-protein kinase